LERIGKHYVLSCHGGDEKLAQSALDAVEAVWPIVAGIFGAKPDSTPKQPLAVHLYRAIADYEAADMRLTQGKFQRNLAMTHWGTWSSHVAVQPPCKDEALRAIGLPGQTVALLAWEACHLAHNELCPDLVDHPSWFTDGLAAYVAGQVLEQQYPCGGAEAAPFCATQMTQVQRLQLDKKLPSASNILADKIDDLDFNDRYAARAVFFRFLAGDANKGKLVKLVDVLRRTGRGPAYAKEVLAAAIRNFGASLDKDFAKFVAGLRPRWSEVFRSLTTAGRQWHQLAFPDKNAIAWNSEPVKGGAFEAAGALRILPGEQQQLNFLFARTDDGFCSIAFTADRGFTVFDYQSRTNEWKALGNANAPGLRLGYSSTFAIQGKGAHLVVHLDQLQWEFQLARPLPAEVVWGLGAQNGSGGFWSEIEVGPARK
jgi:hypothetical protein